MDFYREWFSTHLRLDLYVEVGFEDGGAWRRNVFDPPQLAAERVLALRRVHPVHQSVARYRTQSPEDPLYPLVWVDIDAGSPSVALREAVELVGELRGRYGCDAVLVRSPSKGVHVWIPLKRLLKHEDYVAVVSRLPLPPHTDAHIKDTRKMARLPYTFKVVGGERRYSFIMDKSGTPIRHGEFSWDRYEPLDPALLGLAKVVVEPKIKAVGSAFAGGAGQKPGAVEKEWVAKVVSVGLPDGRKRFMLMVLVPYLTARGVDEEGVLRVCRELVENSCRNFGNCGEVYDSWVRSAVRSSKASGFKGFGLKKLMEKDPQLFELVSKVLGKDGYNQPSSTRASSTGASPTSSVPSELGEFFRDTGLAEFSYEDFRGWLESRYGGLSASEWHRWERLLRLWAEEGFLGRKFLVGGEWVDYGPGRVARPPSKEVRFYLMTDGHRRSLH